MDSKADGKPGFDIAEVVVPAAVITGMDDYKLIAVEQTKADGWCLKK